MLNTLNKALILKVTIAALVILAAIFMLLRPKQESGNFTGTWQAQKFKEYVLTIKNNGDHYTVDSAQTNNFFGAPQTIHNVFTVKETDPFIAEHGSDHLSLSQDKKTLNANGELYNKISS
jgi:hypothetical protein